MNNEKSMLIDSLIKNGTSLQTGPVLPKTAFIAQAPSAQEIMAVRKAKFSEVRNRTLTLESEIAKKYLYDKELVDFDSYYKEMDTLSYI